MNGAKIAAFGEILVNFITHDSQAEAKPDTGNSQRSVSVDCTEKSTQKKLHW